MCHPQAQLRQCVCCGPRAMAVVLRGLRGSTRFASLPESGSRPALPCPPPSLAWPPALCFWDTLPEAPPATFRLDFGSVALRVCSEAEGAHGGLLARGFCPSGPHAVGSLRHPLLVEGSRHSPTRRDPGGCPPRPPQAQCPGALPRTPAPALSGSVWVRFGVGQASGDTAPGGPGGLAQHQPGRRNP